MIANTAKQLSKVTAEEKVLHSGRLIVNADDWGRDRETTERIVQCFHCRAISSASAMVFMADSERAAEIARELSIDTGLHLNLTTPFSSSDAPRKLIEHQRKLSQYLLKHRYAQVIFHPGLATSFEYVVATQLDEYRRLYGAPADRIDGHHHMHLCANIMLGRLLPTGTIVRRNFSFWRGEKSFANRLYRQFVDRILARRHRLVDFFFSLPPLNATGDIQRILSLARNSTVEVATHPVNPEDYRVLAGGEIFRYAVESPIAPRFIA